ncbi:MAG: tetratricopeptide repeat protein [Deltaproteobacteria bacterium]|nr:tetratricopeptide repeat protein [Deltaproteobacteria bacterium]
MTENRYKKKMSLTGVVAQLVTIGLLFVFWRLGQKWVIVPAAALLVFLLVFLPKVIGKLEERFHKKALLLLATGKAADVTSLASRQVLLSLFGASAPIDAKLGLALSQLGRFEEAIDCLGNAIPYAPQSELPALQTAHVKALLVTGDTARAEAEGRQMLKEGVRLPEVMVLVARARLGLGKGGPDTLALLEEAAAHSSGGDVALMLRLTKIETQLAYGKKPEELKSDADSSQPFLRAWLHLVRGKLREHRGKIDDALTSYAKAVKEGKEERCWFTEIARERFEMLSKKGSHVASKMTSESPVSIDDATAMDDVARRKRRKRR